MIASCSEGTKIKETEYLSLVYWVSCSRRMAI